MRKRKTKARDVIKFKSFLKNTIYDVLKDRGFVETDGEDWNIHWVNKKFMTNVFDTVHFDSKQRVNHFRTFYELTRKDYLVKNLKKKKRQLEQEGKREEALQYGEVCPPSWILPHEYYIFENYFNKNLSSDYNVYIMKPCASSQGKGIFLVSDLSQLSEFKKDRASYHSYSRPPFVIQRYVHNPYLVGGKKFDMRIYVCVTSYNPLVVYIYREGFCRFSHSRYSMNQRDLKNAYIHLTNVAIQKHSEEYDHRGCKWSIRRLREHLTTKHGKRKTDECFNNIQKTILLALNSVKKIMLNDYHCFEMYGFDILINQELRPYILEINASPSLTASTNDDYLLKYNLLNDLLDIIDLEKQYTTKSKKKSIKNFCGFDLVYKDKTLVMKNSNLGWYIDRKKLRRNLRKQSSQSRHK